MRRMKLFIFLFNATVKQHPSSKNAIIFTDAYSPKSNRGTNV